MKTIDYRRFKEQVASLILTQGLLLVLNFLFSVLTTRWLAPAGKGELSIATTIASIGVQFGIMGLQSAHTYYLSKDRQNLRYVLGNSVGISVAAGVIAAMILCVIRRINATYIGIDALLLSMSAVMVSVQLFYTFQSQTILALNRVGVKNLLDTSNVIFCLGLVLLLRYREKVSATGILSINIGVLLFLTTASLILICVKKKVVPCLSLAFLKKTLPYGILAQLCCLMAYLLLRIDVLMINRMCGSKQTGIYSLGVNLADLLSLISSSVGTLLFPVAVTCRDNAERMEFTQKTGVSVCKTLLVCSIPMFLLAPVGIPIIYGEAYRESVVPFLILIPGVIAWGLVSIVTNYFAAVKKFRCQILSIGLALVCNLLLNALLIPVWGIAGAAVASSLSYLLACVILWYIFWKSRRNL